MRELILSNDWKFWVGARQDSIGLHADGSISGVRISNHEYGWALDGDKLSIMDRRGRPRYELFWDGIAFTGTTLVRGEKVECRLEDTGRPRKATHYRERGNDRILTESRLGNCREFLLVTFNSLGKPFSGVLNEWEMYQLPNHLSVDYLRFSATSTPRTWYADKIDRVYPMLRAAVLMGYRQFVFVGVSAGGYAALLFSEMLGEEFKNISIKTMVFNATLLPGEKHRAQLLKFDEPLRSSLPVSPLTRSDNGKVDIPDILADSNCYNILHEIHYDSLNEFETYQIAQIEARNNIRLVPSPLNLPHGLGTIKFYRSGLITKSVRKLLPPLYPPMEAAEHSLPRQPMEIS